MSHMKVVAVVGMTGSGKSEVARFFQENGFTVVRFGEVTDIELKKQGLPLTEENERPVREAFRKEHGMAAYAILNLSRIDEALKDSSVVVDGLYSWEEYLHLKEYYGDNLVVVAVYASPGIRYTRLAGREIRPLTAEEAESRDRAEIENMNKAGPIAMADFTLINETSFEELKAETEGIISRL
jgi:dephospho-CoA kinase